MPRDEPSGDYSQQRASRQSSMVAHHESPLSSTSGQEHLRQLLAATGAEDSFSSIAIGYLLRALSFPSVPQYYGDAPARHTSSRA